MPDTPHDHGAFAELVGLPLAKPMFSRYLRLAEELGLSEAQLTQLRSVQQDFFEEMSARHADLINLKNELRQLIVDVSDSRTDSWDPVFDLVDRIYDIARSLDRRYYQHMRRGFAILSAVQSQILMDAYEREELERMPSFQPPSRGQR
jgi:hypothetical protein